MPRPFLLEDTMTEKAMQTTFEAQRNEVRQHMDTDVWQTDFLSQYPARVLVSAAVQLYRQSKLSPVDAMLLSTVCGDKLAAPVRRLLQWAMLARASVDYDAHDMRSLLCISHIYPRARGWQSVLPLQKLMTLVGHVVNVADHSPRAADASPYSRYTMIELRGYVTHLGPDGYVLGGVQGHRVTKQLTQLPGMCINVRFANAAVYALAGTPLGRDLQRIMSGSRLDVANDGVCDMAIRMLASMRSAVHYARLQTELARIADVSGQTIPELRESARPGDLVSDIVAGMRFYEAMFVDRVTPTWQRLCGRCGKDDVVPSGCDTIVLPGTTGCAIPVDARRCQLPPEQLYEDITPLLQPAHDLYHGDRLVADAQRQSDTRTWQITPYVGEPYTVSYSQFIREFRRDVRPQVVQLQGTYDGRNGRYLSADELVFNTPERLAVDLAANFDDDDEIDE